MRGLAQDVRYALRSLRRTPGFTVTAVATLGLGIGVCVAMYTTLYGVLLRPLPYEDPDRLVMIWIDDPTHNVVEEGLGYPTYDDWRAMNRSFDDLAATMRDSYYLIGDEGNVERRLVNFATHNLFSVLNAEPSEGRTFTAEEDESGDNVAVISQGLRAERFGNGAAVGESLRIDGRRYEVIGVMAAGFGFPHPETVAWTPWPSAEPWGRFRPIREGDWLRVVGRLKPGVSLATAQEDMNRMAAVLTERHPPTRTFAGYRANVVPLLEQITGDELPRRLWLLLGAVGFVFLIACFNVANLVLVRNGSRGRELALRESLGASAARLRQLLLAEAALLAVGAIVVGITVATLLVPAVVAMAPPSIPRLSEIAIDVSAWVYAFALGALACLLAAIAPRSTHHLSTRAATEQRATRRLQSSFVVIQAALSLMLLCGVGLFVRSLQAASEFDLGYSRDNVTLAAIDVPPNLSPQEFFSELLPRLASLPGVRSVGAASQFQINNNPDYSVISESGDRPSRFALTGDAATAGYFQSLGVPLIEGRTFSISDRGKPVAVVNQRLANQLWPGVSAVGERFRESTGRDVWYTVVGVVADMSRQGVEIEPIAQMFRPGFTDRMVVAVRRSSDDGSLDSHIREQVTTLAPAAPMPEITTIKKSLSLESAPRRFHTQLLTGFALVALLLCAIGLFGLQRYTVERRRREIGLRMAVGANQTDVMRLIVGQGVKLIALGTVAGIVGSLWIAGLVQSLLFEVDARDQSVLLVSALVLLAVGVAASYLPARRATRIEPTQALKQE